MYSEFLKSRHALCRQLIERLKGDFAYVSVLGKQVTGDSIRVTTVSVSVDETMEQQSGFVAKLYNGYGYSEYSFSDITEDTIDEIESEIRKSAQLTRAQMEQCLKMAVMEVPLLTADYERPMEGKCYTIPEIVDRLTALKDQIHAVSDKIAQVIMRYECYECSACFFSPNRSLTQDYSWCIVSGTAIAREGAVMQSARDLAACNDREKAFSLMTEKARPLAELAVELLGAENIVPGVYDIITTPSITGLIAHEAFGHGVEMDMFVKNRARSRHYINKPVASPLVNMHDGAAAVESCVGYFFDDDGVAAHDTQIIKDGILLTGISDAVSAMQLGSVPTGNGRRQEPSHKAYTRMTNTFFESGRDKLEDMIASVEHGYMLFSTDNGMEDPKNWNIQCVAQYGREIRNGKFTGKIVAPVVMSGYVPDLLMSVSMVSDCWEVIGSGHCGKGYKEWVTVSDGGPYLKAKCKLG